MDSCKSDNSRCSQGKEDSAITGQAAGTPLAQGKGAGEMEELAEELQGHDCHAALGRGPGGGREGANAVSVGDHLSYEHRRARE